MSNKASPLREENYPSPRSPLQEFFDAKDERRKSAENSKIEHTFESLKIENTAAPETETQIISKEVLSAISTSPEEITGSPIKSPPRKESEHHDPQDQENDVFLRPLPIERLSVRFFLFPIYSNTNLRKKVSTTILLLKSKSSLIPIRTSTDYRYNQ